MATSNLKIFNFRCFSEASISLSPGINFFFGKNGAGKTSILEAIHLASSGKSFKSSNINSLLKDDNNNFLVESYNPSSGSITTISKELEKPLSIKLNNKKITKTNLLIESPSITTDNHTYSFTNETPAYRRKMLDRILFVSDSNYRIKWMQYQRLLKQRNAALRIQDITLARAWSQELANNGEAISDSRSTFLNSTKKNFNSLLNYLSKNHPISQLKQIDIIFYKGWEAEGLFEEINKRENIDVKAKTTTKGPHKADIQFIYKHTDAKHILSRGEQKLLSIIWTYAQHKTIKDMFNKEPVLILDDIKSELDNETFNIFLSLLELIETQVIFSCIEDIISSKIEDKFKGFKKFHVEQFKK